MDMASSIQALASSLATTFASRELLYLDHYKRGALTLLGFVGFPKFNFSLSRVYNSFFTVITQTVVKMPMIYRVPKKVWI